MCHDLDVAAPAGVGRCGFLAGGEGTTTTGHAACAATDKDTDPCEAPRGGRSCRPTTSIVAS